MLFVSICCYYIKQFFDFIFDHVFCILGKLISWFLLFVNFLKISLQGIISSENGNSVTLSSSNCMDFIYISSLIVSIFNQGYIEMVRIDTRALLPNSREAFNISPLKMTVSVVAAGNVFYHI